MINTKRFKAILIILFITVSGIYANITDSDKDATVVRIAYSAEKDGVLILKFDNSAVKDFVIPKTIAGKPVTNIGDLAFSNLRSLRTIVIPDTVKSIGNQTFKGCTNLRSVTLGSGVKSIGDNAFEGCESLSAITIPTSVTRIGNGAFEYCTSLTSVTIPASVTQMGKYVFFLCSSLKSITVSWAIFDFPSGWSEFWNTKDDIAILYGGGKDAQDASANFLVFKRDGNEIVVTGVKDKTIKSVVIPNGVTSIGSSAFSYCTNLTSITIPNSVTLIGESAFWSCENLISITIPNSVTSIGEYVFNSCEKLTNVTIPNSVTSIGKSAFDGCENLISITIPSSVTSIKESAFYNCKALTNITIPNSVTLIGDWAFYGCESLTSIVIPNGVTSIEESAFIGCTSLKSIDVDKNNLKYMGADGVLYTKDGSTLMRCPGGKDNITILPSVTSVDAYAFFGCNSLKSINVDKNNLNYMSVDGVLYTKDGSTLISYPSGKGSVTILPRVTSIGKSAFNECKNFTSITIPNSVTSIGEYAFDGCKNLTSITIPNSVASIGKGAFVGCDSLKSIDVDKNNLNYMSVDGVLYTKDGTTLVSCPGGKGGVTILPSVTSIGKSAFDGCRNLTSITIPNSVTSIGERAFWDCKNLTSITIPNSVTSIEGDAFSGWSQNQSIKLPKRFEGRLSLWLCDAVIKYRED